jgi:hypothetical protein
VQVIFHRTHLAKRCGNYTFTQFKVLALIGAVQAVRQFVLQVKRYVRNTPNGEGDRACIASQVVITSASKELPEMTLYLLQGVRM